MAWSDGVARKVAAEPSGAGGDGDVRTVVTMTKAALMVCSSPRNNNRRGSRRSRRRRQSRCDRPDMLLVALKMFFFACEFALCIEWAIKRRHPAPIKSLAMAGGDARDVELVVARLRKAEAVGDFSQSHEPAGASLTMYSNHAPRQEPPPATITSWSLALGRPRPGRRSCSHGRSRSRARC